MSRLGNYLSVGHGELHPSPLAGNSGMNNSPPGGPTFVLRSPPEASASNEDLHPTEFIRYPGRGNSGGGTKAAWWDIVKVAFG